MLTLGLKQGMSFSKARAYIAEHGILLKSAHKSNYIYKLTKELKMFKICVNNTIVNLLVPAGEMIHIGKKTTGSVRYKCRVSKAYVFSICKVDGETYVFEATAHHGGFKYIVGEDAIPDKGFDDYLVTCASGIHGFVDIDSTLRYRFD